MSRAGILASVGACLSSEAGVSRAFLIAELGKNPLAMQETPLQFLGWEDSLEKG